MAAEMPVIQLAFAKAQVEVDCVVAIRAQADPLVVVGLSQIARSRRRQSHRSTAPFRDAPGKADEAI